MVASSTISQPRVDELKLGDVAYLATWSHSPKKLAGVGLVAVAPQQTPAPACMVGVPGSSGLGACVLPRQSPQQEQSCLWV